jgi:hypothetical protein
LKPKNELKNKTRQILLEQTVANTEQLKENTKG